VPIASNTLGDNRVGSVGRPNPEYAIRLAEDGEIRAKGPGVFAGYLGQPEDQSAALFDADGYFKTGDFGYLDDDGYLFVTGRREDFFKTSTGRKIAPFEVESAYKRSPWIEHIVVVGQARKHLLAIIQLKSTPAATLVQSLGLDDADPEQWVRDEQVKSAVMNELRRYEADLEPYKRVRAIVLLAQPLRVETGELTSTLKVRRDVVIQRCEAQLSALRDGDDPGAGGKHAA
jgi:long-chain acyl-CoA synthetase